MAMTRGIVRFLAGFLVGAGALAAGGGDILSRAPLVATAAAQDGNGLQATKVQKEIERIGVEISKFKEEVEQLRSQNSLFGKVTALAGILGGVVGSFVIGGLGMRISNRINAARVRQMRQQWELERERNNIDLFRDLASPIGHQQRVAAAMLTQRLFPLAKARRNGALSADSYEMVEFNTMLDVLVAVIKEKPKPGSGEQPAQRPTVGKDIADKMVKALGAVVPEGEEPSLGRSSPLAGMDWQGAQLVNVWWKRVDARGLDFFDANFERAGLAEAYLSGAQLYGANLQKAVLRRADLRGANLQGADLRGAELAGADLTGAKLLDTKLDGVRADATTKWPAGFHAPVARVPEPV
jgi:pentapeptide repeat protein